MFFHLFPYFLRSDESDTRTASTPESTVVRNPQRQFIFAQAWEWHASLRRYAVDRLGSRSARTPGWLSSVLNLVTLLTFSFVTHPTPLTLKPPCHLIALAFRQK
jgi:hypothetical protein